MTSELPSTKVNLSLQITDGSIEADIGERPLKISPLTLKLEKKDVFNLQAPININLNTASHWQIAGIPISLPIKLSSEHIYFNEQFINVKQSKISVAGMLMDMTGQTRLSDMSQDWSANVAVKDLSQLPISSEYLHSGKLSGAVKASFRFVQNQLYPFYLSGSWSIPKVNGSINYNSKLVSAVGPINLNTQGAFTYSKNLNIKEFRLKSDLTQLKLKLMDYLNKPTGIALKINAEGLTQNKALILKPSTVQFHKLKAQTSGSVAMQAGQNSQFKIQINKTSLYGFDKFIPLMSQSPMRGFVEVNAQVSGDIYNPEKVNISLSPIKLANVSTSINYEDKKSGLYINGPVSVSAIASIKTRGKSLKQASVDINADASRITARFKKDFHKTNVQTLKLRVSARQAGNSVSISQGSLNSSSGLIGFSGTVSELQKPRFNLKTNVTDLSLANLSQMLPLLKTFGLSGTVNAKLGLKGVYDFKKPLSENNIMASGSVAGVFPSYTFKTEKKSEKNKQLKKVDSKKTNVNIAKNKPLLPQWPIFKNSVINYKVQLRKLDFDSIIASGITVKGIYNKGQVTTNGSVAKVFDGQVKINNAQVFLLKPLPITTTQVEVTNINILPATNWVMPKLKNQVSGRLSGKVNAKLPFPGQKDFLKKIKAQGIVQANNAEMKTLSINKIIQEKLKSIPNLGDKKIIQDKALKANAKVEFDLNQGKVNLKSFHAIDPKKTEIIAKGFFDLDMLVNLTGTIYLANPPVRGSVMAANADKQGRLILPISVQGNLLQPNIGFAKETVAQLINKTIEYEKNKLIKKETETIKKNIQNKAKEELKKLFK